MTPERANEIVNGVAMSHPALKPLEVFSWETYAAVTYKKLIVTHSTFHGWFEDVGALCIQTGFDVQKKEWFTYFREMDK